MNELNPKRTPDSERSFRDYEKFIYSAVCAYPKPVSFAPIKGHSPYTDEARSRAAISSWCRNQWTSEISGPTHAKVMDSLTTWVIGENIFIGPKFVRRAINFQLYPRAEKRKGYKQIMLDPRLLVQARTIEEELKIAMAEKQQAAEEKIVSYAKISIADLVDGINEGVIPSPQFRDFSEETLAEVRRAIGDKLNVAYIVQNDKIQIF